MLTVRELIADLKVSLLAGESGASTGRSAGCTCPSCATRHRGCPGARSCSVRVCSSTTAPASVSSSRSWRTAGSPGSASVPASITRRFHRRWCGRPPSTGLPGLRDPVRAAVHRRDGSQRSPSSSTSSTPCCAAALAQPRSDSSECCWPNGDSMPWPTRLANLLVGADRAHLRRSRGEMHQCQHTSRRHDRRTGTRAGNPMPSVRDRIASDVTAHPVHGVRSRITRPGVWPYRSHPRRPSAAAPAIEAWLVAVKDDTSRCPTSTA